MFDEKYGNSKPLEIISLLLLLALKYEM